MPPNNQGQPLFQGPTLPPTQNQPVQPTAASQLKPQHPWALIIPLIVTVLLLLGALGFGFWSFSRMQDYKNNSDKKSAAAVAKAEETLNKKKDAEFAEESKKPNKAYAGPATMGSVSFSYAKTWSAFVTAEDKLSIPVEGYFHPNVVPGVQSDTSFALRLQVLNQAYDQVLKQFESSVKTSKAKISAYRAPKVESVLGSRIEGAIAQNKQGYMVVLPLRDKTLKIWTEADTFRGDFDNTVLSTLTFSP